MENWQMFDSFSEYKKYLDENKEEFPHHIYEFASNEEHHNLTSPHSLHDAWISSITIKENRNRVRPFEAKPNIEIVLLGPMHDRDFILKYEGIDCYEIKGTKNPDNWADTFHGDILQQEIRINDHGKFVHKIMLGSNSTIEVVCENITFQEQMHSK